MLSASMPVRCVAVFGGGGQRYASQGDIDVKLAPGRISVTYKSDPATQLVDHTPRHDIYLQESVWHLEDAGTETPTLFFDLVKLDAQQLGDDANPEQLWWKSMFQDGAETEFSCAHPPGPYYDTGTIHGLVPGSGFGV